MRTMFYLLFDPPVVHVDVRGSLDLLCCCRLRKLLYATRFPGCVLVEADLSRVSSVDADAFCMLDQERDDLERAGGSLCVTAASDTVRRAALEAGYACGVHAECPQLPAGHSCLARTLEIPVRTLPTRPRSSRDTSWLPLDAACR